MRYEQLHPQQWQNAEQLRRKQCNDLEGDLPTQSAPSNPVEGDTLKAITTESERTLSGPAFPFNTSARANILQRLQPEKHGIRDRSESASKAGRGVSGSQRGGRYEHRGGRRGQSSFARGKKLYEGIMLLFRSDFLLCLRPGRPLDKGHRFAGLHSGMSGIKPKPDLSLRGAHKRLGPP